MRTFPILAALMLLATLATLPHGAAQCTITTSDSVVVPATQSTPIYHVSVEGGLAVYQESNGIGGLQRDDDAVDDTCGGAIPADTQRVVLAIL